MRLYHEYAVRASSQYRPPLDVYHTHRRSEWVIGLSRLLESKAPIEREREETGLHQRVLQRGLRKGRTGERPLHSLCFDEAEVIDPQPSTWSQYPVEFSQGLLEFKPMMHAEGRHHRVKEVIGIGQVRHITALEMHPLFELLVVLAT
jgi:hypothetical protein